MLFSNGWFCITTQLLIKISFRHAMHCWVICRHKWQNREEGGGGIRCSKTAFQGESKSKAPQAGKAPQVSKASQVGKASQVSKASQAGKAHQVNKTSQVSRES